MKNITIKDGLPQNTVNDIDQDHQGFIWFATQVGAARYDGYNFEYFSSSNGLPDDVVNCLLVDHIGRVWFGTQGGIAVYDGTEFEVYDLTRGLVDNRINGMIEDLNSNVWAWTENGLSVITRDTILNYTRENALTDNSVIDVMMDSKGRVHVATYPVSGITLFEDTGIYETFPQQEIIRDMIEVSGGEIWYATQGDGIHVSGTNGKRILGPDQGLGDTIILSLYEDSHGNIWCGTYQDGLYVYKDGGFNAVPSNLSTEPFSEEIYEDRQGRIWIMDFVEGVWIYDAGGVKHITDQNSLIHNDVVDIFEDKYGTIWMATLGGASKYGKRIFEFYDKDYYATLPNNIQSVFVDSRGRIWFGSIGQLFNKQEENIELLNKENGFPEFATPFSFTEDEKHNIYIGTDINLLYFDGSSVEQVDLEQKSQEITIFDLLYTDMNQLWCATDLGVIIRDNEKITVLGDREGLVQTPVNALLQMDQMIYCATDGGISLFDLSGKHIRNYTGQDGLSSIVCNDVTQDSKGNIWVATNSNGVSKIPPDENSPIVSYNTYQGLISNTVYFVEFRDSISLWIGTNRGINVLNTQTEEVVYYGQEEGFYPMETYSRAVSQGSRGDLWIGTVEGLAHYDPRYDIKNLSPPDLILYPPLVEGEIYSKFDKRRKEDKEEFPENPAFQYSKNSFVFNFTAIHTTNPSLNRFSFILEGFDNEWSDLVEARSIPYDRLPNGHYVFRLKAFNLDGVEVEQEASFAFTIKPPFWKTIWFILFMVLASLSMILGTIKYRERQLIREKRILERKVKERTREIEDQKVEIESQRDKISEQKDFVEQQRDKIAYQNKNITASIQYARRIQQAVLPGKLTLEKTLPEHFILFKPRDIVSGDFYWVEQKEEQIIVCAADCTGHGVPGAFMSMLGLTFLNEIVNKDGILMASEILNRLRTYIIQSMSHKDEDHQAMDGMDISLVVIDKQLNSLEYAGAYNPLILIREGEMIEFKADKMPVGKHVGEETPFTNQKVLLQDKDMIYMFSDGYPDQFGGDRGSKYKAKPFKRMLNSISSEPVTKQEELLDMELKTWMGNTEQIDDILVMGIRYLK